MIGYLLNIGLGHNWLSLVDWIGLDCLDAALVSIDR
jgi:hypothetical protein